MKFRGTRQRKGQIEVSKDTTRGGKEWIPGGANQMEKNMQETEGKSLGPGRGRRLGKLQHGGKALVKRGNGNEKRFSDEGGSQ